MKLASGEVWVDIIEYGFELKLSRQMLKISCVHSFMFYGSLDHGKNFTHLAGPVQCEANS